MNISHGGAPAHPYIAVVGSSPIFYTKSDVKKEISLHSLTYFIGKIFFSGVARTPLRGSIPPKQGRD
jgi:hypothetical protein